MSAGGPAGDSAARRYATDGTPYIVAGTLVASLGVVAFQVIGGRSLGPEGFDPVTALLTVHFLVFTVLLLPVEQFEVRRVTLGLTGGGVLVTAVVVAGSIGVATFVLLTRHRYFDGDAWYVAIALVSVVSHTVMAVGRGRLAGARRFRAYGLVSGAVAMVRLALALVVVAVAASGPGFGWALALAGFVTLAWRPFGRTPRGVERVERAGRFLGGFVLAAAASQVLLLAAPLVVRLLDSEPGLMSVVFVTFQVFRAPIVVVQNLLARLLPPFTTLAATGRGRELGAWATRFGWGGVAAAVPAAALSALFGPAVIGLLFGEGFTPSAGVAAAAAAGMVLASAALLAGQVLVAAGRTGALAASWLAGLVVAAAALPAVRGGADLRVTMAFALGEAAALAATVVAARRSDGTGVAA